MNPNRPSLDPAQEATLILNVQAGDLDAFEPLVDRHLSQVRTFIALRAPAPHLVDELAHETFVHAFRNLHRFQPGTSFAKWLRAIAWNLLRAEVKRFAREQARQAPDSDVGEMLSSADQAETDPTPDAEFLADCLRQLPSAMRDLVMFKYAEERSGEDIARRLARSTAWVWTTLFRVRQQLRECIERKKEARPSC